MKSLDYSEVQSAIKEFIEKSSHVIIKVGTNLLAPEIKKTDSRFFYQLAKQISKIKKRNKKIILVSSGSVGMGKKIFKGMSKKTAKNDLVGRQALASIGQGMLINIYRDSFKRVDTMVGQILASHYDFHNRDHYKNLKNTIDQLLEWGVVPIVNENDTVATDELYLGDNDTLAAFITGMYPNAILIILTTVDGFYIENKKQDVIRSISPKMMEHAGEAQKGGVGGMKTKLIAAKKILRSGQLMAVAHGKEKNILESLLNALNKGTWFFPDSFGPLMGKKRWILHSSSFIGNVILDKGAYKAISGTASLLNVGVKKIEGEFLKGDLILIKNQEFEIVGKGIASIDSKDIFLKKKEKGVEVIHRDNMVLL